MGTRFYCCLLFHRSWLYILIVILGNWRGLTALCAPHSAATDEIDENLSGDVEVVLAALNLAKQDDSTRFARLPSEKEDIKLVMEKIGAYCNHCSADTHGMTAGITCVLRCECNLHPLQWP